jgi:hypothetical protein
MNPTTNAAPYNLVVGAASMEITARPHSIQTVVFKVS